MTIPDFDKGEGYLNVYRQLQFHAGSGFAWGEPKSKENRKRSPAMLPDFAVDAVQEHVDAGWTATFDSQTLIFSSGGKGKAYRKASGRPIMAPVFNRIVKVAAASLGLPPAFHTHHLRHSCATNMLAAGASIVDVADQLGDDPKTVLGTYVHSSPESRRAALSRVATQALGDGLRPLRPAELADGEVVEGEVVEG